MTYFGAKHATANEIEKVLGLNDLSDDCKLSIYKDHINDLNKNNKGEKDFKLNMANRIFVSDCVSINPTFRSLLKDNFKAEIQTLNFDEKIRSAKEINNWVSKETNGKIKNLVTPNLVTPDSVLFLINAIYFKATWKFKFDERFTKKSDFFLADKKTKRVDMMQSIFNLKCKLNSKRIGANVCEVPYFGDKFSMLLVLPTRGSDIGTVEKKLNPESFHFVLKNLKQRRLNLHLPKFQIKFRKELKDDLKKMGMVTPFSSSANFRKMINDKLPLTITNVIHEAVINVDENGTEASAATFIHTGLISRPFDLKFNRPFIYIIYDKSSENILFIGKLVKP